MHSSNEIIYGRVLLVTLGHVDHGKSTLVKTLTGIDPDRLPEEKILQGTTDLGFAYFKAKNNKYYGFIDVPGHRDYIKNLLLGILNSHFYILVIDASEGIMPQTLEHIELIKCLNMEYGIIVLSKIDLVDGNKIQEVSEEIKLIYEENELSLPPIVSVSFTHNIGIEQLKEALSIALENTPPHLNEGDFILPIIRTFTIKGKGTVITGPVVKGSIKKGDTIIVGTKKSIVKEIQIFRNITASTPTGVTAALNLPDIKTDDVKRGDIVTSTNTPDIYSKEALIVLHHSKGFKNYLSRKVIKTIFFILTSRSEATLIPLSHFTNFSIAKVKLGEKVGMFSGAPYILYSKDLKQLLGGGKILYTNTNLLKHKKLFKETFLNTFNFQDYIANGFSYLINIILDTEGVIDMVELVSLLNVSGEEITTKLKESSHIRIINNIVFKIDALGKKIEKLLYDFHKTNPGEYGISSKKISDCLKVKKEVIDLVLSNLIADGKIKKYQDFYHLPNFKVSSDSPILQAVEKIKLKLLENPLLTYTTPEIHQLINNEKIANSAIEILQSQNIIVYLGENRWVSTDGIEKLKTILKNHKENLKNGFSPKDIKPLIGELSRKHLLPLLEYLDKINFTRWTGNLRFIV
jgi:selenocysteine-specific elongation factor